MNRRYAMLGVVAVLALALLAAACGGGSSGGGLYGSQTPSSSNANPATTPAGAATVGVASTRLGRVVVNSAGRTLYLFEKDRSGQSACDGACATYWPPLISTGGSPLVGAGVDQALVGTTKRADGSEQVTYAGHPLYLYVLDKKPGDTTGEGLTDFGAGWDALTPAGAKIEADAG
jgi:predicted lipoprotein with Yx(FWY)xxD motif